MNPPDDLSSESQTLWRKVAAAKISAGRATMLAEALRCLDRLRQVRAELATAKLTTVTPRTGATHVNPLLKIETELRRQFGTLWHGMNLHFSSRIDGNLKFLPPDVEDDE